MTSIQQCDSGYKILCRLITVILKKIIQRRSKLRTFVAKLFPLRFFLPGSCSVIGSLSCSGSMQLREKAIDSCQLTAASGFLPVTMGVCWAEELRFFMLEQ